MSPKTNNSGAVMWQLTGTEYDLLLAKRAALEIAVTELRELREKYAGRFGGGHPLGSFIAEDLSALLDKIGVTR